MQFLEGMGIQPDRRDALLQVADQVELANLRLSFPIAALYENAALPEDIPDGSSM